MNISKHIKYLSLGQIILFLIIIVIFFSFEPFLDSLLQEYLLQMKNKVITNYEIIWLVLSIPILLLSIVSLVGLIYRKKWAKKGYIYSICLMIPLSFIGDATVEHVLLSAIDELGVLTSGMLFALLIYTDKYEKE